MDILDVVQDFVSLKKSGQSYKALSPFTNEKTPSFYVSPSKEIFKDFSSGKGGDAITFIMEMEGIGYVEALKYLAEKYGIELDYEEDREAYQQEQNEREALYIVLQFAREYFQRILKEHPEGKSIGGSYFRERGFSAAMINKFELGYSLDEWHGLEEAAKAGKYSIEMLEKAGLVLEKNGKRYDRFRGRVVFPIHNLSGKTIAFGARILKKDAKQPKYINSPETPVYHKSDVLYGLYQAKNAIRQADNCYLVEGYTDVVSMHQSGLENVVSSSGTSLTEAQIKLIRRFTKNVTVLFDGDAAGVKASLRGIDMLLAGGLNVRVVLFPDGEDPDSFARKVGDAAFDKFLQDNQQDFISFKAGLYAEESGHDPLKRAESIREIVQSIARIPDPVTRSVYIKESSLQLEMEEQVLVSEMNKILLSERKKSDRTSPPAPLPQDQEPESEKAREGLSLEERTYLQEREALRLMLLYGFNELEEKYRLIDYYQNELFSEDIQFTHPLYQRIYSIMKQQVQEGRIIDASFFFSYHDRELMQEVIDLVEERYFLSENWEKKYEITVPREPETLRRGAPDNIVRWKLNVVKKNIEHVREEIREAETGTNVHEVNFNLKVLGELIKSKKELSEYLGMVVSY